MIFKYIGKLVREGNFFGAAAIVLILEILLFIGIIKAINLINKYV